MRTDLLRVPTGWMERWPRMMPPARLVPLESRRGAVTEGLAVRVDGSDLAGQAAGEFGGGVAGRAPWRSPGWSSGGSGVVRVRLAGGDADEAAEFSGEHAEVAAGPGGQGPPPGRGEDRGEADGLGIDGGEDAGGAELGICLAGRDEGLAAAFPERVLGSRMPGTGHRHRCPQIMNPVRMPSWASAQPCWRTSRRWRRWAVMISGSPASSGPGRLMSGGPIQYRCRAQAYSW